MQIAKQLEKEKVLVPSAYYDSIGRKHSNPTPANVYGWDCATIRNILENQQYTGCTVNGKSSTVSYKVHKKVHKPKEEYQIISNTQEAIIDEQIWLRVADLDKLFTRIYEDNVIGKLPDDRYSKMASAYEKEQKELVVLISNCEKELRDAEKKTVDMKTLYQGLMEFTEVKKLTPTIVNKLIKRIEIHNPEKKHSHNSVKVDITFTAIGLFQKPDEAELQKLIQTVKDNPAEYKQISA